MNKMMDLILSLMVLCSLMTQFKIRNFKIFFHFVSFESLFGTLKAARTRKKIAFKGQLLLFPKDKDKVITMTSDAAAEADE